MLISPSDMVADLERLDRWSDGFDYAGAFVAEDHVLVAVVGVGAAEAGGGDADEDLVILEVVGFGGCGFGYGAVF